MGSRIRIMRIVDLVHRDASGRVIFESTNIHNMVHGSGEEFMLGVLFSGEAVPDLYYMGLDSRSAPSSSDLMGDLESSEPSSNGYERQSVDSGDFALALNSSGSWQATGPTVLFRATGGSWGPVRNIFLCTGLGYESPVLISSAPIGQDLVVQDGETVTMRMAMSLSGC
jgi:hypothetical protein